MGLDMYIDGRRSISCPCCGELVSDRKDRELCYWRKHHDLFMFISDEIAPDGYGDDQYGEDIELDIGDLRKIKSFLEHRGEDVGQVIEAIDYLERNRQNCYVVYHADW